MKRKIKSDTYNAPKTMLATKVHSSAVKIHKDLQTITRIVDNGSDGQFNNKSTIDELLDNIDNNLERIRNFAYQAIDEVR